jgi:hypothetical protein
MIVLESVKNGGGILPLVPVARLSPDQGSGETIALADVNN